MSGGSYDYVSFKIESAAETLRERHPDATHVLALAHLLDEIAQTMHDIEWADSSDTLWTPELDERIRAIISPASELDIATARARAAHAMLTDTLARLSNDA